MFINNLMNPIAENSLLYGNKMIGLVLKTPEDLGKDNVIGCYCPKLSFGLPITKGAYEETRSVDTSKLLNSVNKNIGKKSLTFKNWITLQVAQVCNTTTPKFAKGENVFIECCDGDMKNMFVLPYSLGESQKRKNDIWSVLCPNFPEYTNQKLNLDNTFGIQINTKDKILSMWTGKEGGDEKKGPEKGTYFIGINAAEGVILISDSGKRTVTINTEEDSIEMVNEAESSIEIVKDTINMKSKHMNIEVEDDINIKSSKMKREIDEISTTAKKDTEETDELAIKGNKLESNYNETNVESSSYTNKTSKWVTDSPISGFTKILTSDSYSQWSNAGNNPLPICANISNAGIFTAGYPSTPSIALARAQSTLSCLQMLAAKLDAVGSHVGCPPTSVAAVAACASLIPSPNSLG